MIWEEYTTMKKFYVKPALHADDLSLNAVITGACGPDQPTSPLVVGGFSDDPESEEDPVEKFLFTSSAMGCITIITLQNAEAELGDMHYWCYQNPSDATRIFTS